MLWRATLAAPPGLNCQVWSEPSSVMKFRAFLWIENVTTIVRELFLSQIVNHCIVREYIQNVGADRMNLLFSSFLIHLSSLLTAVMIFSLVACGLKAAYSSKD